MAQTVDDVGPDAISVIDEKPATTETPVGTSRWVVVPSPRVPTRLAPQHFTVPSVNRAQVESTDAVMPAALLIPITATGDGRFVMLESPSWPLECIRTV